MRKREKIKKAAIAGIGAAVIEGDLKLALKMFKRDLNSSGKMAEVYNRRHFVSRSEKRRKILQDARYLQQFKH